MNHTKREIQVDEGEPVIEVREHPFRSLVKTLSEGVLREGRLEVDEKEVAKALRGLGVTPAEEEGRVAHS